MCDFGHETYFQVLLNISSSSSCNPTLQLGIIFHRFFLPFFDSPTVFSLSFSLSALAYVDQNERLKC